MPPGMLERVVERGNAEGGGADDAIVAKIAWNLVVQQVGLHALRLRILLHGSYVVFTFVSRHAPPKASVFM